MDIERLRERFARFPVQARLGHLASDLHRLAAWAAGGRSEGELIGLMREAAWKMEWLGDAASADIADMQRELCRWMRAQPLGASRRVLAFRAERMSARLLEASGLAA